MKKNNPFVVNLTSGKAEIICPNCGNTVKEDVNTHALESLMDLEVEVTCNFCNHIIRARGAKYV